MSLSQLGVFSVIKYFFVEEVATIGKSTGARQAKADPELRNAGIFLELTIIPAQS
jgi:hypothetical protein